jgi:hypothetical protein
MLISYSSFLLPFLDFAFIAFFKYRSNRSTRFIQIGGGNSWSTQNWWWIKRVLLDWRENGNRRRRRRRRRRGADRKKGEA